MKPMRCHSTYAPDRGLPCSSINCMNSYGKLLCDCPCHKRPSKEEELGAFL
jgi:hypothetical protein